MKDADLLQQMLYLDSKTYLPSNNLAYSDKTSMAHSVELRVPFLDMEILDLVQRLPSRYKTGIRESKILLKEVADRTLPHSIVHRKKAGFGLPAQGLVSPRSAALGAGAFERIQTQAAGDFPTRVTGPLASGTPRDDGRSLHEALQSDDVPALVGSFGVTL